MTSSSLATGNFGPSMTPIVFMSRCPDLTSPPKNPSRVLKKQLLFSVITRQTSEGSWRHGEWTDLMESHYRSHNGAMLAIASGLEELGCDEARHSLTKAAAYSVAHADKTDLGLWFLHDSLEESAEAMDEMLRQTGTRWIPSQALGKSPQQQTHSQYPSGCDRCPGSIPAGDRGQTVCCPTRLRPTGRAQGSRPAPR